MQFRGRIDASCVPLPCIPQSQALLAYHPAAKEKIGVGLQGIKVKFGAQWATSVAIPFYKHPKKEFGRYTFQDPNWGCDVDVDVELMYIFRPCGASQLHKLGIFSPFFRSDVNNGYEMAKVEGLYIFMAVFPQMVQYISPHAHNCNKQTSWEIVGRSGFQFDVPGFFALSKLHFPNLSYIESPGSGKVDRAPANHGRQSRCFWVVRTDGSEDHRRREKMRQA